MDEIEIYWNVKTNLLKEKAVRAWSELQTVQDEPERIEILKWKLPIPGEGIRRFVCRLIGVRQPGSDVVAKRCRRFEALVENTIYEEILPYLRVPTVKYYGMVEDTDSEYIWLFLEDVGDRAFSASLEDHCWLSAKWLALMHTSAEQVAASALLPHKGPKQYLKSLQSARDTYQKHLINLKLRDGDRASLKSIVNLCDMLISHWDQVERYCDNIPWTLIHGDFVAKNLRIKDNQNGMSLFPFDWGEAGWGVPAVDIMHVDVEAYYSILHDYWPWLDVWTIQRSAIAGKFFRFIDALHWELPSFN